MSFSSDLANYAKKTKQSIDEAVNAVNIELASNIILNTPVDTGRLRSNWNPSFDVPNESVTDNTDSTKVLAEAKAKASKSAGKVFYLTNNLPYAMPIEYGYSKLKAPQGMVRISIEKVQSALRKFRTTR